MKNQSILSAGHRSPRRSPSSPRIASALFERAARSERGIAVPPSLG
jgi:hypothetical protein